MKKIMFNDKYGLTQAVLEGRKTMTRRVCKEPFWAFSDIINAQNGIFHFEIPKYKIGEVVAVAQCYMDCGGLDSTGIPIWKKIADAVGATTEGWRNKMFVRADLMPHHIQITNIKVERLQDISNEACLREGVIRRAHNLYLFAKYLKTFCTPRQAFAALIDKVSGKDTWKSNPFVWVYEFKLID